MSRQATNRRKILVDHARKGKVLIPPFLHKLGGIHEVSWVQTLVPELSWIGLLHDQFGDKRAVELITALSRVVRNTSPDSEDASVSEVPVFVSSSDFKRVTQPAWGNIRATLQSEDLLRDICQGLSPLAANYPAFPLNGLWEPEVLSGLKCDLQPLKETLVPLFTKTNRKAMMVQATAIWLWFDSGKLKVFEGLALSHFPEIEQYPETELSRRVGASIRSSLNMFFGTDSCYDIGSTWPIEFWNRGLVLEPCEFPDE